MDGGVNKSGTFNYICRECDAKFFQDYENPDNIIHPPTDKFLAEIAVKNMLLQLSKRANEQELIPVLQRELGMYENPDDLSKIKTLDQKEYEEEERHFYFTTNRHFYDKISIKIILDCNKSRCSV